MTMSASYLLARSLSSSGLAGGLLTLSRYKLEDAMKVMHDVCLYTHLLGAGHVVTFVVFKDIFGLWQTEGESGIANTRWVSKKN